MIKLTINKKAYPFPTNWNEITYKQYLLLTKNTSEQAGVLSILLNESISEIENWIIDKETNAKLLHLLSFLNELPNVSDFAIPKHLEIKGRNIATPTDFDNVPFGAKMYCEDLINSKKYSDSEILPYLVASVFEHPYKQDTFSSERIDAFVPTILECGFYEVWKIGTFFLRILLGLPRFGVNFSHELNKMKTELRFSKGLEVKV